MELVVFSKSWTSKIIPNIHYLILCGHMISKKAWQFIGGAYLISWTAILIMYLLGIKYGTVPSFFFLGLFYMTAPAISAVILQKYIYKEPLKDIGLTFKKLNIKKVLTPILLLWLIIALFFVINIILGNADFSIQNFVDRTRELTGQEVPELPIPPVALLILMVVQGGILGAIANFPFALGEELGWRGLLFNETKKLGFVKSSLIIGIVWGIWHAPVILMGHNYPGYPVEGIFMMTLFTLVASFLLNYLRIHSGSVVSPTIFHGALNGVAGGLGMFIVTDSNPLITSIAGIVGIVAILLTTIFVYTKEREKISYFYES